MNTDIRLSTSYFNHPKIIRLERELGIIAIKAHLKLLCFTAEYRPKGILTDMGNKDIVIAAGWDGDSDEFINKLIELKLLDKTKKFLKIHNWAMRNAYACFSKERSELGKKAAKARWDKKKQGMRNALLNHAGSSDKCDAPVPSPIPIPIPIPNPIPIKKEREKIPFDSIIKDLNEKSGKDYKPTTNKP